MMHDDANIVVEKHVVALVVAGCTDRSLTLLSASRSGATKHDRTTGLGHVNEMKFAKFWQAYTRRDDTSMKQLIQQWPAGAHDACFDVIHRCSSTLAF
eukprot:2147268-Pleurochrysis_carterae.AAC.3